MSDNPNLEIRDTYDKYGHDYSYVVCLRHPDGHTGFGTCQCSKCENGWSTNHDGPPYCHSCIAEERGLALDKRGFPVYPGMVLDKHGRACHACSVCGNAISHNENWRYTDTYEMICLNCWYKAHPAEFEAYKQEIINAMIERAGVRR